jgi:hypothetical protein
MRGRDNYVDAFWVVKAVADAVRCINCGNGRGAVFDSGPQA